jgi:purine-binding chemotaxis protein CheW
LRRSLAAFSFTWPEAGVEARSKKELAAFVRTIEIYKRNQIIGGEPLEGIQMANENVEIQLVVFRLGDEEYGVPITQVQEIIHFSKPTRVPKSPPFIEGVINLRGRVIPVIDLKKRFEVEAAQYTEEARIVVVEIHGHTVGLIVSEVSEVLRLPQACIEPPPAVIAGITANYLQGVGKLEDRLLILLDLNKILTAEEENQLVQSGEAV